MELFIEFIGSITLVAISVKMVDRAIRLIIKDEFDKLNHKK